MKKSKILFVTVILFFVILYARTVITQAIYYSKAENFFSDKKTVEAVDYYSMAIQFYSPFSPLNNKSINRLLEIYSENKSDNKMALYSLENLRTSIYFTKYLWQPHINVLDEIEPLIAGIRSEMMIEDGYRTEIEELTEKNLKVMQTNYDADNLYSFLASFSFVMYIMMILAMIWYGKIKFIDKIISKKFLALAIAASFISFCYFLYLA